VITRAIIPAAGFGTRFLPASKAIPKELIPVVDKPTIQYVVEEAVEAGIREILIIISKGKEAICSHFESNPELETLLLKKGKHETLEAMKKLSHLARIQYAYQEEMKGLGDAILCARTFASSEPVAILLGDTILHAQGPVSPLQSMVDLHNQTNGSVIALRKVPLHMVSQYGVVSGKPISKRITRIEGLIEKPPREQAPSQLAVSARYIVTPGLFEKLDTTPPGVGGEIQITDALHALAQSEPVFGLAFEGARLDIGNQLEFIKSNLLMGLEDPRMKEPLWDFIQSLKQP